MSNGGNRRMQQRSSVFGMAMIRKLLLVALVLVCSVVWAAQQAKQAGPPPDSTIRVTTRLVQVSVVAHDRKGEPVADLTKNDFVLLDEGKEQKIAVFAVESNQPSKRVLPPLPPNTYSNELERQPGAATSLTVILFDALNTPAMDQPYARAQLVKFLQQLQPQDRVAIISLGRSLRVLHDFSSDIGSLVRAVRRQGPRPATELEASTAEVSDTGSEELDAIVNVMNDRLAYMYVERRVETTLNAMTAIADYLAALPGRKNLVWVSASFPFSYGLDRLGNSLNAGHKVFYLELARASRAVNNANVAIYPVDARGLVGAASPLLNLTLDTVNELAARTGGRAFYDSNDVMGSIRQALDDSRVTYVLGFYPKEEDWNAKFHRLRVQVKRSGVQVRFRQGYYANPDTTATAAGRSQLVTAAAQSPLEATQLGLTVRLSPPSSPGVPLRVEVILNPRQLTFKQREDSMVAPLTALFLQKTVDGKELKTKGQTFQIKVNEAEYRKVLAQGLAFTFECQIEPGAEQLRIVVCDDGSEMLGSITVPLSSQR